MKIENLSINSKKGIEVTKYLYNLEERNETVYEGKFEDKVI